MTVKELARTLDLEVLVEFGMEKKVTGCYISDLLSWVMVKAKEGDAWLTVQTNVNVVAVASLTECACVIITEGVEVEKSTVDKAAEKGVNLFRTPKTSYELALEIGKLL